MKFRGCQGELSNPADDEFLFWVLLTYPAAVRDESQFPEKRKPGT